MTINTVTPFELTPGTLNGEAIPTGWLAQSHLADEVAALDDRLDAQAWNTLLYAIDRGMPVVLVTRERIGERVVRRKTTVIVEYAVMYGGDSVQRSANRIRVRYWGFGHYVWLGEIVSVDTPHVEYVD